MVLDASIPVRVPLWMAPGLQRSIVMAALREGKGIVVLEPDAPSSKWSGPEGTAALRLAIRRCLADVAVLSAPPAEIRRLAGRLGDTAAVFVSADGRGALSYDGDVSAGTLVRMIRSVAGHDHAPNV